MKEPPAVTRTHMACLPPLYSTRSVLPVTHRAAEEVLMQKAASIICCRVLSSASAGPSSQCVCSEAKHCNGR